MKEVRCKRNNEVWWEGVEEGLKENLGFWDKMELKEKEEGGLKKV